MATTGPLSSLSTVQRRPAAPFARGRQNEGGDYKRSFRFLVTLFFRKPHYLPGTFLECRAFCLTEYTKANILSMMDELLMLRELFQARFDALDARLVSISTMFEKENDRQDEAIERVADRTPSRSEIKRLTDRVDKVEKQVEVGRVIVTDLQFKAKVTWAVGGAVSTGILGILWAIIQKWIGV